MNEMLFYRCEKCGNIVALIRPGGGTLTCCGQEMTNLQANSTDASKEKHVPVLAIGGGKIKVSIGTLAHPMTAEHFIEWIAVVCILAWRHEFLLLIIVLLSMFGMFHGI